MVPHTVLCSASRPFDSVARQNAVVAVAPDRIGEHARVVVLVRYLSAVPYRA